MKFSTLFLAGLLFFVFGNSAAFAETPPPGSYNRTCTNIEADWRRLSASCRTRNGGWNYTVLEDYRRCQSDIANNDGRLQCTSSNEYDDGHGNDWAPRGSYQNSCRNIHVERRTLVAECRDRGGRWRYTELDDYRRCKGDIANDKGVLECRGSGHDWDDVQDELPRGSWRASCRNFHVQGRVLYADCRTRGGRWIQTSLDLRRCRQDVRNDDGRLVCGGYGDSGHGWGRITVYKHSKFDGKSRTYSGDVPDLNLDGFGNIVSSAVIQGGVWQICDRPYYRGYCIVLDRTNSNFAALNFNDRAESIRRLR